MKNNIDSSSRRTVTSAIDNPQCDKVQAMISTMEVWIPTKNLKGEKDGGWKASSFFSAISDQHQKPISSTDE